MFGFGVLSIACQKAPIVEVPVPVLPETPEVVPEEVEIPEVVEANEVPEVVEVKDEISEEDESGQYADSVNNAVALLTGDEEVAQQGLKQLQQLKKLYPEVPEIEYNIGVAQLKLGNDRAAEQAFEATLEIDPKFSAAWVNLGILKERKGDFEGAILVYEQGLESSENDPSLTARKVACLRKMGQTDMALVFAQASLKKNANNVDAYSEVGAVYLEQGNLDKALFVLQQAIARMGGDNANLQSIMGKVYFEQDKKPMAELAFVKALSLNPNLIEPAMYLSFIQIQNRAWAQAKVTLERALLLEPTNASLLNSMGIVHRGLGEIDQAEKMYQDSYQYNPSNPEPLLNLAVLEADYRNDYQKAYTLLDRYLNEGGTEGDLVDQWRTEFQKSEKDFIAEKKRQEMRDLFKRRREEAAKKRAEEEAKQAELDALEAESEEILETSDEDTDGMDEISNDDSGEMDENPNGESDEMGGNSDGSTVEKLRRRTF
jgi:tetratricopeptide (TPR) repeat protein